MATYSKVRHYHGPRAATAADIPPELFESILSFLDENGNTGKLSNGRFLNYVSITKQDLGSISLVCRHWATICRMKIFKRITLRSREDVYQLLSFLTTPASSLGRFVGTFRAENPHKPQNERSEPWLHLIPTLFPAVIAQRKYPDRHRTYDYQGYVHVTVDMTGTPQPVNGPMRSMHNLLPRAYPDFSAGVWHLVLTDIHFRAFNDLIHIVGEMRDLTHLACTRVTWDQPPTLMLPLRRLLLTSLFDVEMSECTHNWAALWLAAGYKRKFKMWRNNLTARLPISFDPQELDCICAMGRSMEASLQHADSTAQVGGHVSQDGLELSESGIMP